jgi:hypothetical protein
MKRYWPHLSLWIVVAAGLPAAAQSAAPATDPAPTRAVKPAPRPMTPVQQAQATATPGELRPERPVAPQIEAPIGRVPPPPTAEPPAVPTETLDQRLARCQAELGEKARTECRQRAELARPPVLPR